MSKEIYISSTPHETRLAIVENDALTEIYYERENEYTLAGSIYNGKVTRVLPGMQSSFVDIGLERDAFLYITDFMEEAPDSAEFETSAIGAGNGREQRTPRLEAGADENAQREPQQDRPRGDRPDRGGRNDQNGRRGRGDRPAPAEREPSRATPTFARAEVEAGFEAGSAASTGEPEGVSSSAGDDGSELGEGAPGADGSRRWRGRRGRRRGRGPVVPGAPRDESSRTTSAGTEQPVVSADPPDEAEQETPLPSSVDMYAVSAPVELEASPASAEPSYDSERGSEREDRGGRGRDRGRGDREGRSERGGRTDRGPRGFTPSVSRYGADYPTDSAAREAPAEPIILPGESLSKYRKGGEAEPIAVQQPTSSTPSNIYTMASGWDGGSILPGESLSRHRRAEGRSEPRAGVRSQPAIGYLQAAAADEQRPAVIRDPEGVSVGQVPETQPEVALAAHPELVPTLEISREAAPTEEFGPAEYEPVEASASYRVDPVPPSEYRHSAREEVLDRVEAAGPVAPEEHRFGQTHFLTPEPAQSISPVETEPEAGTEIPADPSLGNLLGEIFEFNPSAASEATSAEVYPGGSHDVTTMDAGGEMHSEPVAIEPPSAPAASEQPEPTSPIHHETAVVAAGDLLDEHAEMFEEAEEEPSLTFAPGTGDLEEELIDEEEFEIVAIHAGYIDDEMDDLEEETLEGAADLGTMLREMSIDQITRPSAAGETEEEDFTEDEEEADEEETDGTSEEFARTAEATGDFSSEFRDPEASRPNDLNSGDGSPDPQRRGGRRDVRRGGRDRDRRGGDSSGRPRNMGGNGDAERGRSGRTPGRTGRSSMQTTNLPAISELLKPGQEILVQIAKEPIAKKGARITSHIALPGRFLVFMPTVNHTGVSRKIESDGERRRLKEILLSEKGEAAGGFIVRTAASGASEEELRSDLRFLLNLWTDIKNRSESSKSPALIYHDLNLVERILRDQVTDTFSAIWVDTETEYERVLRFLQRFQPSLIRRVKLYLKETPLFEQFGITEEINKALRSKVWLKSGGSIVINQTEALVAIDINTGKFVGKTARLEDTIVKTNLDAIPEIVRQIRLRDLGGIIIIDFIDMDERKNRNKVMAALEEELKSDRAPSKVLQFNDFGLVAITRKRVKQSLERTLSTTCNVCVGTGMVKSPVTVCNDIYIEMRKMYKHLDKSDVMLRVHPEVVKQLKSAGTRWLQEMEEMSGKTILVKSDPSLHPEQFDIH